MGLLAQLGLPAPKHLRPAAPRGDAPASTTARPVAPARPAAGTAPMARGAGVSKGAPKGELTLGGATFEKLSIGPEVEGPRLKVLWALMAEDGKAPLDRSNSKFGAQINTAASGLIQQWAQVHVAQNRWREVYDAALKLSLQSKDDLAKMEKAARAIGERSKGRAGKDLRDNSEAYIKAYRAVEDKLRALPPLEEALKRSVAEVNTVVIRQEKLGTSRSIEKTKDDIEAEKKRLEEMKGRLKGLLGLAIKAVKQDWAGLAEDAAKFVGEQLIDNIPSTRLNELNQQLEKATAHLHTLEDSELVSELDAASHGLRKASEDIDDARADVMDAVKDLSLAQTTAIETLKQSPATADAARMIDRRAKMLEIMARGRYFIAAYRREEKPLGAEVDRVKGLYKAFPGVLKSSPGLDPNGDYAKSLAATANENVDTLDNWKSYLNEELASVQSGSNSLSDSSDEGFLKYFNRVGEVLQMALESR